MQRSRVQVPSPPPNKSAIGNQKSQMFCVSSQIGSRHLPLKQGIVSSSLTWRTNFISGCGVTQAFESWELVVTVQFCPPRPGTLPISNCQLPIDLLTMNQSAIANRQSAMPSLLYLNWMSATLRTSRLQVQVLPGVPFWSAATCRRFDHFPKIEF